MDESNGSLGSVGLPGRIRPAHSKVPQSQPLGDFIGLIHLPRHNPPHRDPKTVTSNYRFSVLAFR